MGFFDRWRRQKNATTPEAMTANQLLSFLGVHSVPGGAQSEATYFACMKVLSEGIGKLPLRLMQATPSTGVVPLLNHQYYRMLHERPNR